MRCYFCETELLVTDRIGRRESCTKCGRDLHICLNCEFYDPKAYNECRENQADRVVDKEVANFCDYFSPATVPGFEHGETEAERARVALEALFKKK